MGGVLILISLPSSISRSTHVLTLVSINCLNVFVPGKTFLRSKANE
jgi:hypothetical protein